MEAQVAASSSKKSVPKAVAAPPKRKCPLTTQDIIDRVLYFAEAFTKKKLYAYQLLFSRRIVESLLLNDGEIITALWSRQSGKTEAVADICVPIAIILPALAREFPDDPRFMPFSDGVKIGVYAPVDEQAKTTFKRMRRRAGSDEAEEMLADPELNITLETNRGDTIAFSNGSEIIARTASEQSQIEGKDHHLIICEEAQKLSRAKVEKEIEPMRAAWNGTMVKIGTAWMSRGGFHDSIKQNIERWTNRKGKRNHFEFPYDLVCAEKRVAFERDGNPFHLAYEKYVQNAIVRLGGVENDEFKMNFRCLWQESRVIAINMSLFRGQGRKDQESGTSRFGVQVAGLDIAKMIDSTVLTVMDVDLTRPVVNRHVLPGADEEKQVYYNKRIIDWLELDGPFEGNVGQYIRLVEYLAMTRVQVLCIDATAMGAPVFERIEALVGGTITCIPFVYGLTTKHKLYQYYLQEMNARRISYAAGEDTQQRHEYMRFMQEHEDLDKVLHGGYVVCEAPEGGHDDYPDSAALACWAEKMAEDVIMPDIVVSGGSGSSRGGSRHGQQQAAPPRGSSGSGGGGRYARRW